MSFKIAFKIFLIGRAKKVYFLMKFDFYVIILDCMTHNLENIDKWKNS